MEAYIVSIQGPQEAVERAIKLADKTFRNAYNVYGVRRMRSKYDRVVDVYDVDIIFEPAQWTVFSKLFPEYTPRGVFNSWLSRMSRERELDDVFVGDLVKM